MGDVEAIAGTSPQGPRVDSKGTARLAYSVALLATFVGIGWRFVDLTEWPFPIFQPVQYESALAARSLWLTWDPSARTPERSELFSEGRYRHIISPPILPALVAASYCLAGAEIPWVSKVFAAGFWVAAAWFLFGAAKRLTGSYWAGVASLTYLLLAPFGLMMSRCFQTESVAVFGLAFGLWLLARNGGRIRNVREVAFAGILCGLLGLTKPGTLYLPLTGAFAGVLLFSGGSITRKLAYFALFAMLNAIPSGLYALVFLNQRGGEIQPHRLLEMEYYSSIEGMLSVAARWPTLTVATVGTLLALGRKSALVLGTFVGYLAFIAVFTFHSSTHLYYHTILLVPVALGIGWVVACYVRLSTAVLGASLRTDLLIAAAVVFGLTRFAVVSTTPWTGPWRLKPENAAGIAQEQEKEAALARAAGQARTAMRPGAKAVALAEGLAFEYWGNLRILPWPRNTDQDFLRASGSENPVKPADQRLDEFIRMGYDYFIVCEFAEFQAQPGLQAALAQRGKVILSTPEVTLFELR